MDAVGCRSSSEAMALSSSRGVLLYRVGSDVKMAVAASRVVVRTEQTEMGNVLLQTKIPVSISGDHGDLRELVLVMC